LKALIYVQHLLGTGHVVRAVALARELRNRGHDVTLVSGNSVPATLDISDLRIEYLPPVKATDATFGELVDTFGSRIDDIWRDNRARQLQNLYETIAPDILITETFPLGRRQFAFELVPVLEAAKALPQPPLIACSVRDILVRKNNPRKERWMADMVNRFYDLVLVHSDPSFVRLEDSFPYCDAISGLIRYTGYVHELRRQVERSSTPPSLDGKDEVIVSSGGGAVGLLLLQKAIKARRKSARAANLTWRLLVSDSHNDDVFEALRAQAREQVGIPVGDQPVEQVGIQLETQSSSHDGTIVVERVRPDFQDLLARARLSVSQAGYNTVLDVLSAKCPAVLVPFEEESESEQLLRAELLQERGSCRVLREKDLSGKRLARTVDKALDIAIEQGTNGAHVNVHMDGAAAAAEILTQEAERRFGR